MEGHLSCPFGRTGSLRSEASDSIAEKGVTIIDLDEEQRQAWIDASQPLYEKYSGVIGEDFYNWFMEFVDSMR